MVQGRDGLLQDSKLESAWLNLLKTDRSSSSDIVFSWCTARADIGGGGGGGGVLASSPENIIQAAADLETGVPWKSQRVLAF